MVNDGSDGPFFSRIGKNEIYSFGGKKERTILVNHAEKKGSDIDIHKKVSKLLK